MFDTDGRPLHVAWNYSRAELLADAIVHVVGLTLAIAGGTALLVLAAFYVTPLQLGAIGIYTAGLVALLAVSAAYNMWPISRTKWVLRRFDHACIFVLIAATYTPFMSCLPAEGTVVALTVGVWTVALSGAALKLALPGRFDRLAIALYLLLGLSGALAWDAVSKTLSGQTVALIIAGGLIYAGGIIFHLWESMRFQNAVWHSFVLVASAVFYVAILRGVVLA